MKENFLYELNDSQTKFVRTLGTIKYLKYLKNKNDLEVCPICTTIPKIQYAMLNCGHHMCMLCLSQMIKHKRNKITCSICRHQEEYKEFVSFILQYLIFYNYIYINKYYFSSLFYVTCDQDDINNDVKVKGDYPVKILSIVENVLLLTREDKNVCLLLFSRFL